MILGPIRPDAGTAAIAGKPYRELASPVRTAGALLEAAAHPGRAGRDHLRVLAAAAGVPGHRADQLLDRVGLAHTARAAANGHAALGVLLHARLRVLRHAAGRLVLACCRVGPGRPLGGGG